MTYLTSSVRLSELTINGTDYTQNMVSWNANDSSCNKNGIVVTTGQVVLGSYADGTPIEDYDRNNFKRGAPVILEIYSNVDSTKRRHPRGLLYVISTSYDPETELLSIEIGCRLALSFLIDDSSVVKDLVPIPLDPAQQTIQNCAASFGSAGQYAFQDSAGAIQVNDFFDGDSAYSAASGEFVSVNGLTALSVSPLQSTGGIPDEVILSYNVPKLVLATDNNAPKLGLATDNQDKVDTDLTESYYFLQYPVSLYRRVNTDATDTNPNGTILNAGAASARIQTDLLPSACGNTPAEPSGNGDGACNEGYELRSEPLFLPAYRRDSSETRYTGPGAQMGYSRREVRGPFIEANRQYFADKYVYCRSTWSTQCNPNGNCPHDGMKEVLLQYTTTENFFGEANEIVKTIQDTYDTILSAANVNDWRSGIKDGVPQDFNDTFDSDERMYRSRRVVTEYRQENNTNIQEITTWSSTAERGIGITSFSRSANRNVLDPDVINKLDALNGIKTFVRRTSATATTLEQTPDILNSPTTATETKESKIVLFTSNYVTPPAEAGPYIAEENIPVPLLFDDQSEIDAIVNKYSIYIQRFLKGDAYGLEIGETLRDEIMFNWRPGMPFRYYDPKKNKLMAMRMDACSWGVTRDEAAVVFSGVWIGDSNGTVSIGDSVVGNTTPDINGSIGPLFS